MIIHTFGGQASIMGKDLGFLYNGPTLELKITGLTFEEAQRVLAQLESGSAIASTIKDVLAGTLTPNKKSDRTDVLVDTEQRAAATPPVETTAKPTLTVDPERMKAIAAASPQKPPKAEKETKKGKGETKKAGAETSEPSGETEEASGETPPPAESTAKPVTSKTANGAANGAAKPKGDVPQALIDARRLRDVITFVVSNDKIEFGEPGTPEREEGVEKLKKRCAELKDVVPCLSRINDLDSRIERTIEVMDMGEEVS